MSNELTNIQQTPALQRKAIARNADVMGALLPVERSLFLASTDKSIDDYTSVQLAKELRDALQWIAKDVGFRPTNESDSQYLVVRCTEILKRYYRELSLKDFRMAFEMCLTGELDAYLPKNREGQPERSHYQNFNAEYICRILNAYRNRRGDVFRKVAAKMPAESGPEMTSEAKRRLEQKARQYLLDAFEHFKQTSEFKVSAIQEIIFYEILSESGLADEIIVTDAERKEVLNRALSSMMLKGASVGEMQRKKTAGINAPEIAHPAFSLARHKALLKIFEDLKNNEIKLEDYVRIED